MSSNTKAGRPALDAVRSRLFSVFPSTVRITTPLSPRNLMTLHVVVTGTHCMTNVRNKNSEINVCHINVFVGFLF